MSLEKTSHSRYAFLDGLRGVACLGVMLHHLYHNSELQVPLSQLFPAWVGAFCTFSARGVHIFFVLSGFVIAYSLRGAKVTAGVAGNFALRRHIRLDPTYWVFAALMLCDGWLRWYAHPSAVAKPALKAVVANLFYLAGVLHMSDVPGFSWTLCLEVQFYLVFILLLGFSQLVPGRGGRWLALALVMASGLASLMLRLRGYTDDYPWFIATWYMFAVGVLTYWALEKVCHPAIWIAFIAMMLGIAALLRQDGMIVGAVTAGVIYLAGRTGHLTDWLSNRVIQYFGRISYSLFLIHVLVLARVYKIGMHMTGLSPWPAVGWVIVATVCSVIAAHLLYIAVERPTMTFANRFKQRRITPENAAPEPVSHEPALALAGQV